MSQKSRYITYFMDSTCSRLSLEKELTQKTLSRVNSNEVLFQIPIAMSHEVLSRAGQSSPVVRLWNTPSEHVEPSSLLL
jgi:hypothetical protein